MKDSESFTLGRECQTVVVADKRHLGRPVIDGKDRCRKLEGIGGSQRMDS
ncbi:MAG: hypothetical protein HYU36_22500 [Planctomycetes bacterium]|nr:hypothetical protein [Planctomycetota bacterium]